MSLSISTISLACSLFAILILLILCPCSRGNTNQASIRLLTFIAFADAMYSVFQIVSHTMPSESFLCSLSAWGLIYFTLSSVFLRLAVVINIQLAVVKSTKSTTISAFHYLLVAMALPLLLSIVPISIRIFGRTPHKDICWFKNDGDNTSFLWQWFFYYMWVLLGVLYSIISILLIVRYLQEQQSEIQGDIEAAVPRNPLEYDSFPQYQSNGLIKQAIYRTCWYPIIPIISQSFVMVSALILTTRKETIFPVYLISVIATALQGTLTAIVFANDPAVNEAASYFQKSLVKKYYYDYQQAQHLPPKIQGRKGSITSLLSNGSSPETTTSYSTHSPGIASDNGMQVDQGITIDSNPNSSWLSHLLYKVVRRALVRVELDAHPPSH
ncbi:hypothetical protein K493DRAFT_296337 [Basidiobolus meristosporus CBS 931.73]|uniref:G-protein coupled receptors family 2 profile 2 domain-containing protein n=1 Tax=Basidiobolus meristosporus CBS 931.73 TaxID=1314790 RepID=A0A1Y1Z702_9FUNG|nr:hypothetical protein K493DRAFT_296337 [Basidiobolus meristosporus CBS 931.73]|eukprot:ORY05777.1 hypothetical protein K493DRAFT_296337 [Basidiobolus meristosporus CBS 931.73]